MIYVTRREHFNAAHKLRVPEWSDEKNNEIFGKCANPNWHGHNYDLFVTVKGEINPETGFLVDLKLLSKIIKEKVESIELSNIQNNVSPIYKIDLTKRGRYFYNIFILYTLYILYITVFN